MKIKNFKIFSNSLIESKYFPSVLDVQKVVSFAEEVNKILPNSVIYSSGSPFSMKYPTEKLRKMLFKDGSLVGVVSANFDKNPRTDSSSFRIPITIGSMDTAFKNVPDYNGDTEMKKVRFPLYVISKSSDRRGIFEVSNLASDSGMKTKFYSLGVKNDWLKPSEFDVYLLQKWGSEISEVELRDMENDSLNIVLKIEK